MTCISCTAGKIIPSKIGPKVAIVLHALVWLTFLHVPWWTEAVGHCNVSDGLSPVLGLHLTLENSLKWCHHLVRALVAVQRTFRTKNLLCAIQNNNLHVVASSSAIVTTWNKAYSSWVYFVWGGNFSYREGQENSQFWVTSSLFYLFYFFFFCGEGGVCF